MAFGQPISMTSPTMVAPTRGAMSNKETPVPWELMTTDHDTFETVAGPGRRSPARTAAWLAVAGALTMAMGAVLLVLTVGLFDNSLTSANERGADRTQLIGAEIPVGSTNAVVLDGDQAKALLAIVGPDVAGDLPGEDLDLPTVRIAAPDGSTVPVTPTDPLELTIDGDRRAVAIGQFRTGEAGDYEVQVAADGGDATGVGVIDALLPNPGDLGGAAGTFLLSAAAATLLGIGALLSVLGAAGWMWFRRLPTTS